jgi:GMP synthase PP-ATPase subunit
MFSDPECGYHQVVALRAVQSEDFMTADWYVLLCPGT